MAGVKGTFHNLSASGDLGWCNIKYHSGWGPTIRCGGSLVDGHGHPLYDQYCPTTKEELSKLILHLGQVLEDWREFGKDD